MVYKIIVVNLHAYVTKNLNGWVSELSELEENLRKSMSLVVKTNRTPYVLLMDITEGRIYENIFNDRLNEVRALLNKLSVEYTFVCDGEFQQHSNISNTSDIMYVDFLPVVSYTKNFLSNQKTNKHWDDTKQRGLWIPGKADRPHRVLLMSKLWENNLLDKVDWSFYPNTVSHRLRTDYLSHYDDDTFKSFINDCSKELDVDHAADANGEFSCNGYPYNHNIFERTSFSIVAESDFMGLIDGVLKNQPKLTEKTYRTMANMHPMIISWFPGMCDRLEELGYKSFREYMITSDYNNIQTLDSRLNATVKNIQFFISRMERRKLADKIRSDVEHNYELFISKSTSEIEKLNKIFDLPQDSTDRLTLNQLVDISFPNTGTLKSK